MNATEAASGELLSARLVLVTGAVRFFFLFAREQRWGPQRRRGTQGGWVGGNTAQGRAPGARLLLLGNSVMPRACATPDAAAKPAIFAARAWAGGQR
jgi:hypothetical protein